MIILTVNVGGYLMISQLNIEGTSKTKFEVLTKRNMIKERVDVVIALQ